MKFLRNCTLAAALLGSLSGCGGNNDGIGRKPVSGKVNLDGNPLPDGSVMLVPTGSGPAVGGTIDDGSFSIPEAEGPIPGSYRVEIVSIQSTGRTIPNPEGAKGTTVEERKNVVPDRYGARTELKADVTNDGPNSFAYELVSKPEKPTGKRRR